MLYCKKPQITLVHAHQWFKNGDHPQDYPAKSMRVDAQEVLRPHTAEECQKNDWEGEVVRRYRHPGLDGQSPCVSCGRVLHDHGRIDGSPMWGLVCPGDYVITDEAGAYSVRSPEAFAAEYMPLATASSAPSRQEGLPAALAMPYGFSGLNGFSIAEPLQASLPASAVLKDFGKGGRG